MKKMYNLLIGLFLFGVCGQAQEQKPLKVKEVIVICKTHFDIGYTHRVDEVVNYYQTSMIDKALKIMDGCEGLPKDQQFSWTLPGWVLSKIMDDWDGQTFERRQRLEQAIHSRQLVSHALPFTPISDIAGLEEMVRGLNFSSALNRTYGFPLSRSAKLTDEPSHTGALVTVLAHAGVKFLHIGCNPPSEHVKTPGLFWWEGPDGARVLTMYSSIYGTCYMSKSGIPEGDDPRLGVNLLPAEDWDYPVWPAIWMTGDNAGPPTAEQIRFVFDDIKKKMPDVKVRMGTLDDFYDALMKEVPEIPIVKEDMPDSWIHGVMCDPRGIQLLRETRSQIASAELFNTQLKACGIPMPAIDKEMSRAYELLNLYDEHTWGGRGKVHAYGENFKKLSPGSYADLEASWEDKTNYVRQASEIVKGIIQKNWEVLTQQVKSRDNSLIVCNPLPWTRSGLVEIDGKEVYVKNIPASGYKVVRMNMKDEQKLLPFSSNSIENKFFRITFDKESGCISSWIEKAGNKEWIDQSSEHQLGQYLNERFTYEQTVDYVKRYQQVEKSFHDGLYKPKMISEKDVPYRAASPKQGDLQIYTNGYTQMAELKMPSDVVNHLPASVLRVTMYKDQPYVDMEITIHETEKDNWPEADWLCLPFKIDEPEFNVYRQLGVMNPKTDILSGSNRHMYVADQGVSITGKDGAGIFVCPIDHPVVSLGTPGCWKWSADYIPEKPVIYLNLFNNQWNTNFRYWYTGSWNSRVRLWTIKEGTAPETRSRLLTMRALETRNPLQAVFTDKNKEGLPSVQPGIKVSREGVIVTAFGVDPDGNEGTLLRIWEQVGVSGKLVVTLPKGMDASIVIPVDLRGEAIGKPIAVVSDKFEWNLGAYAPASFILK